MDSRSIWRWAAVGMLSGILLLAGCRAGDEAAGEACQLKPGEVLVNEFMASPEGRPEWIELYNPTDRPLSLNRAVMAAAGAGEPRSVSLIGAGTIQPRGFFVIGSATAEFVDYVYQDGLNLNNDTGSLELACQGTVSDTVRYGDGDDPLAPTKGRSLAFDSGATHDPDVNDQADYWCTASERYDGLNRGTPGAPNAVCGIAICMDVAGPRGVRSPGPGEVRITEVLAAPADTGEGGQWLEFLATGEAPFDLNGLDILNTNANGSQRRLRLVTPECLTLDPGKRRVVTFAAEAQGAPQPVVITPSALYKDGGDLSVLDNGDVLDSVRLPTPQEGVSLSLDPETGEVCPAPAASPLSRAGEKSTPGLPNDPCGPVCFDAAGKPRRLVPPRPGELVVTEVLADPADADSGREWLEVYVNAAHAIDLNGLQITDTNANGNSKAAQLQAETCLRAEPGSFVVLAGPDSGLNDVVAVPELGIYNEASVLTLAADGLEVDSVSLPAAISGVSANLDAELVDGVANDRSGAFCSARTTGLFDGVGTPGRPNDLCGACMEQGLWRRLVTPQAGDLIITEVYADAEGADEGREWIELYVAASGAVDLNGIMIVSTNTESGRQRQAAVTGDACLTGRPGDYPVIGGALVGDDGVQADVTAELDLYNTAVTLAIENDETLVDMAALAAPVSGVSASLDRTLLDGASNDEAGAFCEARSEGFFAGKGTPGAANEPCGAYCLDEGGQWRALRRPAPGDLVINEVYANPPGADNQRDWLELFVAAGASVDLNGLALVHRLDDNRMREWRIEQTQCRTVQPGTYGVITGANAAADGVSASAIIDDLDFYSSSDGTLSLVVGADAIDLASIPAAVEEQSQGLDPSVSDPSVANDSLDAWCLAVAGATPGAVNQACP